MKHEELYMSFVLQAFGPFLHWLTLGVLAVTPILAGFIIYKLGSLPGSIARVRGHPQHEAISLCGWMGVITIVLWPIAMIWAHIVPGKPMVGPPALAPVDDDTVLAKVRAASQRLNDIQARLRTPAGERE
jgi:hypothetical protein